VILVLGGLLAVVRYGVLSPQVRQAIEAHANGLKISRFGRLQVQGLDGDIWSDFTVKRLAVADEKGVWVEAKNLHLKWRWTELLRRDFHAEELSAEAVTIARRPVLGPKGKPGGGLPVSLRFDDARARVEMLPAFSHRRGVYDLAASFDVERHGGQAGRITAESLLHPGDHLVLQFQLGAKRPLLILADAEEAQGGALAGALGLPADRPFVLRAEASGQMSQGRFEAVATSGGTTPLWARGGWTPSGGRAGGRLDLTASRLTAGYARRLGPQATFGFGGRKVKPAVFALEARVAAANLGVVARGFGDLGQRRAAPGGVALALSTPDLTRIIGGGPRLGPAQVKGVLKGSGAVWGFTGDGTVERASLGGYALARVAGPLELSLRKQALSVKARLTGGGGAGGGLVAALLGGAPKAVLEGTRLADGRLLLRNLDVVGAGLKVQASGDRGLLGGLTFKGRAEVSNLAAARAGASGLVTADWSAGQAGARKPWMFTVNAKGARFASGFPELDRLLGPTPGLGAAAGFEAGKISVSKAHLAGAAAAVDTAGVAGPDGLQFKLEWTADGPFHAGPVEIAGRAKGSGDISGPLNAPRAELQADFASIDLPQAPLKNAHVDLTFQRASDGSSGKAALTADSAYGPARAASAFRFPAGGIELSDLSADVAGLKASGSLALRRGVPAAADLTVAVGSGAFLESGKVAGVVKIVGERANLDLQAENALFRGATVGIGSGRLTADGPVMRLPYALNAKGVAGGGPWSVAGRGTLTGDDPGYAVTFEGSGKTGRKDLRTVEPAVLRIGPKERSARLRLASADGGRVDVDARLADGAADIHAQVAKFGLGLLNEDLDGSVDATLAVQGQGARLDGTLDARLDGARGRGAPVAQGLDGTLKIRLADNQIAIDGAGTNGQGLKSNVNLVLPAEASAAPFRVAIVRTQPMHGRFSADGEVKPLWDLLVGGERSLAGHVRTQGTLGGSIADPTALGEVEVDKGRFEDGPTGLVLNNVALQAGFANAAINVTQATGDDAHGGNVSGSGRINMSRGGVSSFRLDLKGFRLIDNELASASATGQATIDRAADGKVRLSGALTIDRADVAANPPTPSGVVAMDVVERNRPPDLQRVLAPPPKRGDGWALDVTLKAPRRVFLRGRGLDLELSLDARVTGSTARPILTGVAHVVRGDYDFAGKRFEFDQQSVIYLSTTPKDIRLDLTATREDTALTAVVRIRGTAAKPEISLTSTPVLPNDEVLAQVLFGRSASQLSPLEAAQLASALSALAGGGGFDVIGNLRNFAGLDRLALGGDATGGMTVSGGKYLTDNVYLELTGGGREGSSAEVEWRINHHLSVSSSVGALGDGSLTVRWRRDY
jgi:translocation and assembly module TamB